jgi:hypothetical protein
VVPVAAGVMVPAGRRGSEVARGQARDVAPRLRVAGEGARRQHGEAEGGRHAGHNRDAAGAAKRREPAVARAAGLPYSGSTRG